MKKRRVLLLSCLALFCMTMLLASCSLAGLTMMGNGLPTTDEVPTGGNMPSDGILDFQTEAPTGTQNPTTDDADEDDFVPPEIGPVDKGEEGTNGGVLVYDVSDMAERVMPSIVSIAVSSASGNGGNEQMASSGSGILLASDEKYLYVMTNNHVVSGARRIEVTFVDGATYEARIKGTDSSSDLAVILVELKTLSEETASSIRLARIGDSGKLRLGQAAVAIGNALGYGQSVTVGCISALDRQVESKDGVSVPLIQTDAAINPGNSGGALLNLAGEVVGITSMKFASTNIEGMGYAIPMTDAIPILRELIEGTVYTENKQGYLGVSVAQITSAQAAYYGMPMGVYVQSVTKGEPAALGGLKAGDIITGMNGRSLKTTAALLEFLSRHTGGETITVTVERPNAKGENYETVTLTVTLICREQAKG